MIEYGTGMCCAEHGLRWLTEDLEQQVWDIIYSACDLCGCDLTPGGGQITKGVQRRTEEARRDFDRASEEPRRRFAQDLIFTRPDDLLQVAALLMREKE